VETEKVCVNLSAAELGKLDILVAEGVYVSRTDGVRAALRREFDAHLGVVERHLSGQRQVDSSPAGDYEVVRTFTGVGYTRFDAEILRELILRGQRAEVIGAGIVTFDDDVTPELADGGIHRIRMLGSVRGPKPVLEQLRGRIQRGIGS
jgi:hypothetical protein